MERTRSSNRELFQAKLPSRSVQRRWPRALVVTVIGIGILYCGSAMVTPLYPLYQSAFRISQLGVTEIYAVYALGNLGVLFLFGRLSDQLGRRRVAIAGICVTILSALCFLFTSSFAWMAAARVLNGFAAGLGASALTAWIAELEPDRDHTRAAVLASAGNLAGLAFGALLGGVLAHVRPAPLRAPYIAYVIALVAVAIALGRSRETVDRPVDRLAKVELRPRLGVPRGLRIAFVAPAAIAFAAFALGGFYGAITPALLSEMLRHHDPALIGGVVATFFGAAAATAALSRPLTNRKTLFLAVGLLLGGLATILTAEALHSLALFLAATIVAGSAMALGYRGSLRIVNSIAPSDARAELVSSYLLVCYTANALPVLGIGLLSQNLGATTTHRLFAAVLTTFGLIAGGSSAARSSPTHQTHEQQ